MTWSYDPEISTTRDAVRLHLGDTDTNTQLLSDEEIDYALMVQAQPLLAAANLASSLAARFAREVDKSVDGDSISSSQRFEHFNKLAEQLREEATRSGVTATGMPFAGGISYTDKEARELDADRVPTAVRIGVHDLHRRRRPWVSEN